MLFILLIFVRNSLEIYADPRIALNRQARRIRLRARRFFAAAQLNERSLRQPRQRRPLVAPQTRGEIQDPPGYRQIAVDSPRGKRLASRWRMISTRVDVRFEAVVVNTVEPYIPNKRVQVLQRPCIAFDASLPSKLRQASRRTFP